jgi:hypothetical protein
VTIPEVILAVPLTVEFALAPVNLWSGRTMGNFTRYTGLSPRFATHWLAPVKLAAAILLAAGVAVPSASLAGATVALSICLFYLVRLAAPGRRDRAGLAGFALFGALAASLLVLSIVS